MARKLKARNLAVIGLASLTIGACGPGATKGVDDIIEEVAWSSGLDDFKKNAEELGYDTSGLDSLNPNDEDEQESDSEGMEPLTGDVTGSSIAEPATCNVTAKPQGYNLLNPCNVLQHLHQALVTNDNQSWSFLNSFWDAAIKEDQEWIDAHPNYVGEPFTYSYLDSQNKEMREEVFQGGDSLSCAGVIIDIDDLKYMYGPTITLAYEVRSEGQVVGLSLVNIRKVRLTPDSRYYYDRYAPWDTSDPAFMTDQFLNLDGAWFLGSHRVDDATYFMDLTEEIAEYLENLEEQDYTCGE